MYIHSNFIQKDTKRKPEREVLREVKESPNHGKRRSSSVIERKTLHLVNSDLQKKIFLSNNNDCDLYVLGITFIAD